MFKKIMPILAVLVLVLSMMIGSVSAAEVDGYPEFPSYYGNSTYIMYFSDSDQYVYLYEFNGDSESVSMTLKSSNTIYVTSDSVKEFCWYRMSAGETSWGDPESYRISDQNSLIRTLKFSNIYYSDFDVLNADGSIYYPAYDGSLYCDGSTCPATDVNIDNICDDCGMVFSVLRNYTPSDFPSGYPPVPSLGNPNARYFLYRVKSTGFVYILAYPSTVTPTYDSTVSNGTLYFSESYGNYRLDTTKNEWVLSSDDSPYEIGGFVNAEGLYSSVQIYDENGDPFFPIPLWVEMEQVTQGEIPSLQNNLVGQIMTLVLCGVGLIALLVVLLLFGKVLRRYLPQ